MEAEAVEPVADAMELDVNGATDMVGDKLRWSRVRGMAPVDRKAVGRGHAFDVIDCDVSCANGGVALIAFNLTL